MLDQIAAPLGDYVAVARSRDSLRLISTADADALGEALGHELDAYQAEPRRLSPVPYAVRDGVLEVWDPPPGHPCRGAAERAQQVLAATEYGYQHGVLDDLFPKAGEDVFVGKLSLMERPDGSLWSWAAWVESVTDGLTPRCDYLGLRGDDDEVVWVRWDDAVRLAGDALRQEPGYYPPRWRVRGWPAADQVAQLSQLAVDPQTDGR